MKPIYRLIYVSHPKPSHPDYGVVDGAFATCWVNEPVLAAADVAARERLESAGWDIETADEHILVTEETCLLGTPGFEHFEQAQVDNLVVVFCTWPVGAPDE